MKKIFKIIGFLALIALLSVPVLAKTFLGVEVLASKADAMKTLCANYNNSDVEEQGSDLLVWDPSFAGFKFSLAKLNFTPINGSNRFNGIIFRRWFELSQVNEAKDFIDAIIYALKKKYSEDCCLESKNDQGFSHCVFGTYEEGAIGNLDLHRSKGKDGVERFYVDLVYFPFDDSAVQNEL